MTRPATTQARGAREKKRTPARRTAHIEYQPAGLDRPGTALCGAPGPWADVPDGLFPPLVTCRACQHITANAHITITGGLP
jgi:hypothetical protein